MVIIAKLNLLIISTPIHDFKSITMFTQSHSLIVPNEYLMKEWLAFKNPQANLISSNSKLSNDLAGQFVKMWK